MLRSEEDRRRLVWTALQVREAEGPVWSAAEVGHRRAPVQRRRAFSVTHDLATLTQMLRDESRRRRGNSRGDVACRTPRRSSAHCASVAVRRRRRRRNDRPLPLRRRQ